MSRPFKVFLFFVLCAIVLFFLFNWQGKVKLVGKSFDRGQNGIWLQHGWLGDDSWFVRAKRLDKKAFFRSDKACEELAKLFKNNNIKDIFPHLCPTTPNGHIQPVDKKQTKRFLAHFSDFRIIPWVGGVLGKHAFPGKPAWRKNFVLSCQQLLAEFPQLAGVQINIEPCPSTTKGLLTLLEQLRAALPKGKIISVAAYPPPTKFHPFPSVHWEEEFFRQVARRCDQMAVMMYDTALETEGFYRGLMATWTKEILEWSEKTKVLLGVAVYDDKGVGYHHPHVENLENGLAGIHKALLDYEKVPLNFQGVAIYCEWEMDESEWRTWQRQYLGGKP